MTIQRREWRSRNRPNKSDKPLTTSASYEYFSLFDRDQFQHTSHNEKCDMLRLISLDIWAAIALAIVVAVFDPIPTIFVGLYLALFGYVVVGAFGGLASTAN
jgi:hypothetical protein